MACLPLEITNKIASKYPGCWDDLDMIVDGVPIDEHCMYPIATGISVVTRGVSVSEAKSELRNNMELIADATTMVTVASWRKHKQIYKFEEEMQNLLLEQGDSDLVLPIEVLYEIPYNCIYVQLNNIESMQNDTIDGFFVSFEYDMNTSEMELRLLVAYSNGITSPIPIHLIKGATIAEGFKKTLQIADMNSDFADKYNINTEDIHRWDKAALDTASRLIQLVLYICSQNKEIEEDPVQKKITRKPSQNNIKDKFREVQMWDCGKETSEKIRKINLNRSNVQYVYDGHTSTGHGSPKSPHSRRGHWHHFWTGKKNSDERKLVLKWLAPTFINGGNENEVNINVIGDRN